MEEDYGGIQEAVPVDRDTEEIYTVQALEAIPAEQAKEVKTNPWPYVLLVLGIIAIGFLSYYLVKSLSALRILKIEKKDPEMVDPEIKETIVYKTIESVPQWVAIVGIICGALITLAIIRKVIQRFRKDTRKKK